MSVLFDCILETDGISMEKLLGDLVQVRDISRYNENYKVDTRSKLSIDLSDFGESLEHEKLTCTDFGMHRNDAGVSERIAERESRGLTFTGFNPQGYATFEKEWDELVKKSLNLEPVNFGGQGQFLTWGGNYHYCTVIDSAISRKFPDRVFHYSCYCEGDKIDEYDIQNGKVVNHD